MIRTVLLVIALLPAALTAQSIAFAEDLYRHGLSEDASRAFLTILYEEGRDPAERSEALYFLGEIAFDEGNFDIALADWERLINEFSESERADEISDRLDQLLDVVGDFADASATSAIARSYLRNGDFWSKAPSRFTIDSSWLPSVELAVEWYDRLLVEFPDAPSGEQGHRKKIMTLLGWEETGRYGTSYGVRESMDEYMPQVLAAFEDFARAFPESRYLQGIRFQISQVYWSEKDWDQTRTWLNQILAAAEGTDTFYSQLASSRLANLEY